MRNRIRNGRRNGGSDGGAPRWLQLMAGLFGLFVIGIAVMGAIGFGVYRSYASDLQSPEELIAQQPSGGAQIFDRRGNLLYEYVDDRSGLRSPVKLEDISPWMIAATISTEDASYWDNPGVNMRGLARAGLEQLGLRESGSGTSTGGSSITQQLVKNLYIPEEDRSKRDGFDGYERKLKETIYAIELSNKYSKDQILEWYLNQISYGGIYYGVEAASLGYFGKSAKDLTLGEAALLAGIPACPSCYDPINAPEAAKERRNEVLRLMQSRNRVDVEVSGEPSQGTEFQINDDGATVVATDPAFYLSTLGELNIVPQRFPVKAPHWVFDYIQPLLIQKYGEEALYRGGLRVTTTIDLDLQEKAQTAINTWIDEFETSAYGHNGAVVAMDPRTSEILVMVGSRDYFGDEYYADCDCELDGNVNNATAEHSPGSTLKPFTYAATFEKLGWGPETLILDTPISYPDGDKVFTPRNPSGGFNGQMSIRNTLGNSMNVTAFKAALYVGVGDLVGYYKKFGMTTLDRGGYGPSVTIGGVDVTLTDVTYAYTVLAAGGVMRGVDREFPSENGNRNLDPVAILQITRQDGSTLYPTTDDHRVKVKEEKIIEPQTAYMINDILSDPNAFCITYGCGALSIGREWGVKTGTSEPYEERGAIGETWTYGYTPDLVAGVWAGNADNSPMYNITSTSISYRALRDFMIAALENTPASTFERPPGLVEIDTCVPSGMKADAECGRRVKNLLPSATAPKEDDNWWQRARIDIRTGLIATELTPSQFVQERFGLVIPDSVQGFAREQAMEWQRVLGAGTTPTERSGTDLPVQINRPRDNERISGIVTITGKADSENFVAYRLEYGLGDPPLAWEVIIRSENKQPGGGLGIWQTAGLPSGTYTLRLVLEDSERGELSTFITVRIGNADDDDDDDDRPRPRGSPTSIFDRTPTPVPTPFRPGG